MILVASSLSATWLTSRARGHRQRRRLYGRGPGGSRTRPLLAVDAVAPRVLAEEAARLGALLIHYSTDYVFNGEKPEPYLESDPINPVSVYGASKAAGEAAIAETASPLFGATNQLGLFCSRQKFSAHHAPFWSRALGVEGSGRPGGCSHAGRRDCHGHRAIVEQYATSGATLPVGIYHMTAGDSTSWCGFARAIFDAGVLSVSPRVQAIPSSAYPTPARRPANSVLFERQICPHFRFPAPPWQQQLQDVLTGMQVAS